MRRKRVAVFGSTGSIGRATLDVIGRMPYRFEVRALAAHSSTRSLLQQARRHRPAKVAFADRSAYERARRAGRFKTELCWGLDSLMDIAASPAVDIVVMAMSGTMGVLPVIAALEKGKRVAIATKEILVGFGRHVKTCARRSGAELLPIDSELSALFQCLDGRDIDSVKRVILTASGGPFWRKGIPARATVKQVLRHPTWSMGDKTTVDSATMMNKGLEVIETSRLLGLGPDRIDAFIHPQSIVHSLVEFADGSVLAQMSEPDMRLPIQYCLTYPERRPSPARSLRFAGMPSLEFFPLNRRRFPCYSLARKALESGHGAPCVLNAANQVAVDAFLAGQIAFEDIPAIIRATLRQYPTEGTSRSRPPSLSALLRTEARATETAARLVEASRSRAGGRS
ncbi:MAG: 1-deoxy-D-xylulose-5-phosphate reductoisomerase [candidate division WOR-3 bacterium]|nr:MAG: 1-deoxy-D-xylulose-5-phosphate reductoisomerase [candidate division WOR-3 bacterium]